MSSFNDLFTIFSRADTFIEHLFFLYIYKTTLLAIRMKIRVINEKNRRANITPIIITGAVPQPHNRFGSFSSFNIGSVLLSDVKYVLE